MPHPVPPLKMLQETRALIQKVGQKKKVAEMLGIPRTTLNGWMEQLERREAEAQVKSPAGRKHLSLSDGHIIVGSDFHYWPGDEDTMHRAFLWAIKEFIPDIVVLNGDVLDFNSISRHPPIGWESAPEVQDEIEESQARVHEIELACKKGTKKVWTLGNHDARFETKLAAVAPQYAGVKGIHLKDHFETWTNAWSLWINDDLVIKHRWKGGIHANFNNTKESGKSFITGHLHSAKVTPFTDYNGTRYGVDTGCVANVWGDKFQGYTEDNPRNWRSGFCVVTYREGMLLQPELVLGVEEGRVQFRGKIIDV